MRAQQPTTGRNPRPLPGGGLSPPKPSPDFRCPAPPDGFLGQPLAGEPQRGQNVLALQVGELVENLLDRQIVGEKLKDVADADPHAADARSAPTLVGFDGDALAELGHGHKRRICVMKGPSQVMRGASTS